MSTTNKIEDLCSYDWIESTQHLLLPKNGHRKWLCRTQYRNAAIQIDSNAFCVIGRCYFGANATNGLYKKQKAKNITRSTCYFNLNWFTIGLDLKNRIIVEMGDPVKCAFLPIHIQIQRGGILVPSSSRSSYRKTGTGNDWAGHNNAMLPFELILTRFWSSPDVIFGLTLPTGSERITPP